MLGSLAGAIMVVLGNNIWFLSDRHPISYQGFYQPEIQDTTVASCDGITA
jgi:hypothetical protein